MRKFIIIILLASICIHSCKKSETPKVTNTATSKFTITASSGPDGAVTPSGKSVFSPGAQAQYVITPSAGYNIASLSIDGIPVTLTTSYTFTNVQADHTISATFLQAFTVTATAGPNGTVTPPTQVVNSGNSAFITFAPAATYRTDSLWIDGTFAKVLGGATSFSLSNVTANHTIKVSFSDALQKAQIDSLGNLLAGTWHEVEEDGSLVGQQGPIQWELQSLPCNLDDYDVYATSGTSYISYANGTTCVQNGPTLYNFYGTWKLSPNGKILYLTGNY